MKKIFTVLFLALISIWAISQTHEVHKEFGQAWGGGDEVDINNDGHLDFYITGFKNNPPDYPDSTDRWHRMILYNPSTKGYDSVATNLEVIDRANLDWADIDGDGDVDLLAGEHSSSLINEGVWENLGDGMFEQLDWPMPTRTRAAAWGDFNNDAMLDYVAISSDSAQSAVMINNGDGTFETTNVDVFDGLYFGLAQVEVIDYNNDGLMDFFLSANVDNMHNDDVDYRGIDSARVIADIFINYDEEPGNFFRARLGKSNANPTGSIFMKSNGGVDFADFNSDGWIDFAIHGEGGDGTGEPGAGENIWACISHVYLNKKDGTFEEKVQAEFEDDMRPLNSSDKGTATIDWNYDGNYDLIITGWSESLVPNTQGGLLFTGDGAGNFTRDGRVPGGSETVLLFNDWNDDGFLDYLTSGHCWDELWYTGDEVGRTASVFFNTATTANEAPDAPENLEVAFEDDMVYFTWDAATDDMTPDASLSYEVFLKDGDGEFVIAPASFVGGDMDGKRKILKLGNAMLNLEYFLAELEYGIYEVGVQAIDASYEGGEFATLDFHYWAESVSDVRSSSLADIYSYDNTLVVRGKSDKNLDVSIYNIVGQQVLERNVDSEFNVQLPAGIYIVKVNAQGKYQTKKVTIR